MATSSIVFLGCNYNDKKIKNQFDSLKKRIEADTALACIVVDKRTGKSARDLWKDIRTHIEESAACVFDLTGFRPNVVLELGYALSIKSESVVVGLNNNDVPHAFSTRTCYTMNTRISEIFNGNRYIV